MLYLVERKKKQRPCITVSYAQSADGRIATSAGSSRWISGSESLRFAHTLRRDNQAVMVGIGTVLTDDPLLTCRLSEDCPSPVRVILDSRLRIPPDSQIVRTAGDHKSILFCCSPVQVEKKQLLETAGMEVEAVPADGDGRVDLQKAAARLGELGITTLFVEGGARVITSLFRLDLVDTLFLVCAPMIIGRGIEAVGDLNTVDLSRAPRGFTKSVRREGEDIVWEISFHDTHPPEPSRPALQQHTARALYFTAPHTVQILEEQLTGQAGQVLVRSKAIGISHGTESHLFTGSFPRGRSEDGLSSLEGELKYPLKYGYMNAGLSEDGTRVFAFHPHQDFFFLSSNELIPFPDTISFEDLVLYPSVETAYTVVLDTAALPGERILILGLGMIGLLTAEILSHTGGLHITAIDPDPFRRQQAEKLGIRTLASLHSCAPDAPAGGGAEAHGRTPGAGNAGNIPELFPSAGPNSLADKTIHLSGTTAGLQTAIGCTAFEGTVIEGSWFGSETTELSLGEAFHRRRLSLRASQVSHIPGRLLPRWDRARRTGEVINWIKLIGPSKYITHRFPLESAQEAFEAIQAGEPGMLQVLLIP